LTDAWMKLVNQFLLALFSIPVFFLLLKSQKWLSEVWVRLWAEVLGTAAGYLLK